MEDGHSAEEVEAEVAESSTMERRQAAKGSARLGTRSRANEDGAGRQGIPGVLSA